MKSAGNLGDKTINGIAKSCHHALINFISKVRYQVLLTSHS